MLPHPDYQFSNLHHPPIFMLNAFFAATLPIYPGLGQALNNAGLHTQAATHTRCLMALYPGLPRWAGTKKVKRIWISCFFEARDSEWQWNQLGHMQVCTLLQTDNHTSTPPLCFLQAGCPSWRPTNSIKALKADCKLKNIRLLQQWRPKDAL